MRHLQEFDVRDFFDEIHEDISVKVVDYGFCYEQGSRDKYHEDKEIVAEGSGTSRFIIKGSSPYCEDDYLSSGEYPYTYSENESEVELNLQLKVSYASFRCSDGYETWLEVDWFVKR